MPGARNEDSSPPGVRLVCRWLLLGHRRRGKPAPLYVRGRLSTHGECDAGRADAQLVARVNGIEISARQIRTGAAPSVAQAVDKVIDRELLVQKALEAGLERDPLVKDSIDSARRQVLAQAYLDRAAGTRAAPSREEVRAFYAENPALFAERRVYRMRELLVSASAEMIDVLRAQAARTADLDELA